jgi:hypothetical protein
MTSSFSARASQIKKNKNKKTQNCRPTIYFKNDKDDVILLSKSKPNKKMKKIKTQNCRPTIDFKNDKDDVTVEHETMSCIQLSGDVNQTLLLLFLIVVI